MNFFPISVWWQTLANIDAWVKDRGVNVLEFDTTISNMPGDWDALHQKVESLRQQGYTLYVIRQPAYLLKPDHLDITFDQKWKSHLLAFGLDDEFEDKQPGGNLWNSPQPIYDYVAARVAAYKKWMPDVPIFANFNGGHVSVDLKDRYVKMIGSGIDILSSDNYPIANQMVDPTGKPYFQLSAVWNATTLFKSWFPGKPVWTYLETCNQNLHKKGDPGWDAEHTHLTFVGSRAPMPDEFRMMADNSGDGIGYFPEANYGATNDGTDPLLIPVMKEIAAKKNPTKKLTHTIKVYADGSVEMS